MKHFPLFFLAALLFIAPSLKSMDWPSSALMLRNFGWNDSGLPHLGVSFDSGGSIASADHGELLFRRREGDAASRLPSPLGSWAAVDHGDGIISIYSRFEDRSFDDEISGRVEKGRVLGEPGISGWSSRPGFYFQLFDRKERHWINPSMIISNPETRPPQILQVRLRDSQGRYFDLSQTRSVDQGRYVIFVDAIAGNANAPLAPHRIICTLNGSEAGVLNFETYSARNGSLVVYRNGLIPVRQVYAQAPAYEAADLWFSRGQTVLEVIAQDIAGNTRSAVYRLVVE